MKLYTDFQSSNLKAFGWEDEVLEVHFNKGVYHYFKVPEAVFMAMKAAESQGKFLNKEIKNHFEYKKL
jgi:hypothetical protein